MKKITFLSGLFLLIVISGLKTMAETPSSTSLLGITISFSTHAYWDGTTKSCLPRAHGWCLHFEIQAPATVPQGVIYGEISNNAVAGLTLTFSKKSGINPETFSSLFRDGMFQLEGSGTVSDDVLKKLGLSPLYVIPEGAYNYKESGDTVTISFKK